MTRDTSGMLALLLLLSLNAFAQQPLVPRQRIRDDSQFAKAPELS
jgi:hypothetical protein